jgi:hypothetical protein
MLVMLLGSPVASLETSQPDQRTGDRDDPWIQPSRRVQVVADRADAAGRPALDPGLGAGGDQLEPASRAGRDPDAAQQVQRRLGCGCGCGVEAGTVESRDGPGPTRYRGTDRPSRVPAPDFGSVRARCWRQKSSSVGGRALSRWAASVHHSDTHREKTCGPLPGRRCEPRSGRSSHPRGPPPCERA